jgi:hypothetical protein
MRGKAKSRRHTMALFTDCAVTSIEDLRGHDTQLLNVATVEGIDVTRKLALAHDELSMEVGGMLGRLAPLWQAYLPVAMEQLVMTPPLKLWHVYRTLEMVYADAYNSQLNDRYGGKRDEYGEMAKWARTQLVLSGLGVASDPVRQAETPEVRAWAGGLTDGAYYVAVGWTNSESEEGASSVPAMIQVSGSSYAVETTTPPRVTGWNVYSGTSLTTMTIQNLQTLAPGQTWVQPNGLSTTGRLAGSGQEPSYWVTVGRTIQRG